MLRRSDFLVVWRDGRSGYWDIYGSRVTQAGVVLDTDGIVISPADDWHESPCVASDGASWLVVWTDWLSDSLSDTSDIYGAQVTSSGMVLDEFPAVAQAGSQCSPALATGLGNQTFLVYQGWAGAVNGKTYNTDRIWAKTDPYPGIEAGQETTAYNLRPTAAIVRNILFLPPSLFSLHSSLFFLSGQKVMSLKPGPNDVSRVPPGVYFVHSTIDNRQSQIARVVLTR